MIYGRRVIESHQWLHKTGSLRRIRVIDRSYQWKYTMYLLAAIVGSALIFLGPAIYFLHQNYDIFINLADKTDPALVEHLQRETLWLDLYFAVGVILLTFLCCSIGLKLTDSLAGPLISMERHMRRLTQGDLAQDDFRIRASDDYREIANTYGYLYKSLKAQAIQDLKWLEKITIDPQNRESLAAWEALVKTKQSQLGISRLNAPLVETVTVDDAESFATPWKRRVS